MRSDGAEMRLVNVLLGLHLQPPAYYGGYQCRPGTKDGAHLPLNFGFQPSDGNYRIDTS